MNFELLHPADQIVLLMNRIYYKGMTTTSGGNLSVMDDNGDIWISPGGTDKGNLTRGDICRVTPDGTVIGPHKPSLELPFHASIYKKRPDIKAVLHAHSPALVAYSIVRRLPDVCLLPSVNRICSKIAMSSYALPGSAELSENISRRFAEGNDIVVMENHGVCIGAGDLFQAFTAFETLELSSRLEINARKLGTPISLTEKQLSYTLTNHHTAMGEFTPDSHSSEERAARREMVALIKRSYNGGLFASTQGTYSVRLSDGSFVITPFGKDRNYLEESDLVLIKNGLREAGKIPSRSVLFHILMYEKHSDIGSVLLAHPHHLMAFAVTDTQFDPRTIPESYILLQQIKKLSYREIYQNPESVAAAFAPNVPAVICENDCVLTTGKTLLQAFDRLEVAEATAQSLLLSRELGEVVHIGSKEISDIEATYC